MTLIIYKDVELRTENKIREIKVEPYGNKTRLMFVFGSDWLYAIIDVPFDYAKKLPKKLQNMTIISLDAIEEEYRKEKKWRETFEKALKKEQT